MSTFLSTTCPHCGVDASELKVEIERLNGELQAALDRNAAEVELQDSDLRNIARMAVALVRARAEETGK